MPADVIHALNAYKRRHISMHSLMRAMLSHDGWFVPLNWVRRYLPKRKAPDRLLTLSDEGDWPPGGHLWVFTDEEEAYAASESGNALGGYSGPMVGEEVFGALAEGISEVHINHASPPWRALVIEGSKLPYIEAWVHAFRLERILVSKPEELEPWLKAAIYLVPLDKRQRKASVVRVENLPGNFVAAFTAPDRAHNFIAGLSPPEQAKAALTVLNAQQLFGMPSTLPVAGVALNADALPCIVFPPDRCRELAVPTAPSPKNAES
jgi:hypothetical protein